MHEHELTDDFIESQPDMMATIEEYAHVIEECDWQHESLVDQYGLVSTWMGMEEE